MTAIETQQRPLWIVAHDFSSSAEAAADLAVNDMLATRRGGRIVLVHAYTVYVPGASIEGAPLGPAFQHLEEGTRIEATRALERVAGRLRDVIQKAGADVAIEVLARLGAPAETILEEAANLKASRIVVGTHGRTGVTHFLLGSVAERIARLAKIPVLIAHDVKTKKERS